ncbi:hypothetical protein B0T21DRAFT_438763 [Apiosordaria backusii]|uniref:Uncharacterized protein n=1 Tax=Apiosordaria backusii TaxID=314023 RepID=A0AA40BN42_9PEZI|nr:hypothetical protein B0T21DRAFT_438763 [Apiosordaria backusii]
MIHIGQNFWSIKVESAGRQTQVRMRLDDGCAHHNAPNGTTRCMWRLLAQCAAPSAFGELPYEKEGQHHSVLCTLRGFGDAYKADTDKLSLPMNNSSGGVPRDNRLQQPDITPRTSSMTSQSRESANTSSWRAVTTFVKNGVNPKKKSSPRTLGNVEKKLVHRATKDLKSDPDVLSRLSPEVVENLPDSALNELPPERLHLLPEHVLERVSAKRIVQMPDLGMVAKQYPEKLVVILRKNPNLVDNLKDDAISSLRKIESSIFITLPEKVQASFKRILPDIYAQKLAETQPTPPLPPRQTASSSSSYPEETQGPPAQSSPTESPPYLPPLSVSHGSRGTSSFAQDAFIHLDATVQGAWSSSDPTSTMQPTPSINPVPRTSSHPQTSPYGQTSGSQTNSSNPGSSFSSPNTYNSPSTFTPPPNTFSPPNTYSSSNTYSKPHTFSPPNTYNSPHNFNPTGTFSPANSYNPSSSFNPITPYVPTRYETSTPQPQTSPPGQASGSPFSQPVGPSRSSSPLGYNHSPSPPYMSLPNSWSPANGAKPLQHPESRLLPAIPGQDPDPQSFQARLNAQIQTPQGQRESVLPIQNPDPPSLQAQQNAPAQRDPTETQTQIHDATIRELELKVENWGKEKNTLSQQVATLTEKIAEEKEQLKSERQKTDTLNKSIGRLEGDMARLQSEKQALELEKQRLVTEKEVTERVEASITSYLNARKWKGVKQGSRNPFDMIFDFCNEQVRLVIQYKEWYEAQKEVADELEKEKGRLKQKLKNQDDLIAERNDWYTKFKELETHLKGINSDHQHQLETERRHHQQQLEEERRLNQQQLEIERNQHQADTNELRKRLDNHEARHKAATDDLRAVLEADKQNLREIINDLERDKEQLQEQHQLRYNGYQEELQRLNDEHEANLGQRNVAHQQELKALADHCQQLLDNVGYQYELNKQQAVKDLENKVRLLESSLVDNSDDYRPATDDHLQVDFDQINLDINKINHNLPAVDFFQISQFDPGGFLEREGRDQLRFLLQSIFWEKIKSGFFSSPFGLGALGPRDGKRRLLEVWIAYRKLLRTGASNVHLPIGDYDLPAVEQGYIEFLRKDKETNKWRSSTFQAVMAALLPKKDKENSPLTEYLSSPFFHNRNHVRESILTVLRQICVGGISQAIEQTVENMVNKASELALQFGMQRAELGLDMPEKNTLVTIGQGFVICYDNDAEHGMERPVFIGVSPTCYKTGDGRNDTTTTKFISPGHIYPYAH